MLKISDKKFFCEVLADALVQTHLTCADKDLRDLWIKAFAQAAATILEGDTDFLHWNRREKLLLVWSPETNEIRRYSNDQSVLSPCHHLAVTLLVEKYYELQRKPGENAQTDFADAVFFDPELSAREKVELLNLSVLEGRTELKSRVAALQKYV
jgi:hypothetical protein